MGKLILMSTFTWEVADEKSVQVARGLALDAVEQAGHGHPGTAMALAPVAHLLFRKVMKHSPQHPEWFGRDRFILSCGHASMLLYSQLFLTGYGLEISDLKNFRKHDSLTPGHPEFGHTAGVEMTTGPLGQGLSSAVGMAMASRYWRNVFDKSSKVGESIFDNFVYVVASDGDLQEGVTSEASSLAGHLGLSNLIVIYDANSISIDGDTSLAFSENVLERYKAYNWDTHIVELGQDGKVDVLALHAAIQKSQKSVKPSFILLKTIIAWPAPNARNTAASHGAPLGSEEAKLTRKALGFAEDSSFNAPEDVLEYTREQTKIGAKLFSDWNESFKNWSENNSELASQFNRLTKNELPKDLANHLSIFENNGSVASRKSSGTILNELSTKLLEIVGGSADLAESNGVALKGAQVMQERDSKIANSSIGGKYIHFGIREHAMASILNGMALYGFTRPFGATFLIFSDYQKPAIRLASLMNLPVIYIWSHDSIGLGEDGPTHQPVEQLWSLRSIPGFNVIRPSDANEVRECYLKILEDRNPAGVVLTRQNIPTLDRNVLAPATSARNGGYILSEAKDKSPKIILIATGSEVQLALKAQEILEQSSINTRVVAMPCVEWFKAQPAQYQESVLPTAISARISIEAGSTLGWYQFVGLNGATIGLDNYGASAKPEIIYAENDITVENIIDKAKKLVK